jgi:hypothetical protein
MTGVLSMLVIQCGVRLYFISQSGSAPRLNCKHFIIRVIRRLLVEGQGC